MDDGFPEVSVVFQSQIVEICAVQGVDGVSPSQPIVEAEHQNRKADQGCAVEVDPGTDQVGFVEHVEIRPAEVWVGEQHRVPAGRPRGADGPGIGTGFVDQESRPLDRTWVGDEGKVDDTLSVCDHVDRGDRQDDPSIRGQQISVLLGIGVHAVSEGVQVKSELRALRRDPLFGATGDAHGLDPAIRFEVILPPVLGCATACLTVELQNQVSVTVHLSPAERSEKLGFVV